jgi:hypothetical protein
VRVRRWLLAVFVATALVAGSSVVHDWYLSFLPRLGPLEVAPVAPQVSLRVGESLRFTAGAEGATGFTWLLWGRPVSFEPNWSYAPAPEEAGWQQVSVEVTGRSGLRLTRTWDVGVVAPVVPEIESLEPPAGDLAATSGDKLVFRARAHLPAARDADRLAFEWLMDDRSVLSEEHPADAALSELVLPAVEQGSHRLRLRVTEDGRTASLADWMLDVRARPVVAETPAPEGGVAASTSPPPEVAALPAPVAPAPAEVVEPVPPPTAVTTPPSPHLVPMAGSRRLEARIGSPVVLEALVEPPGARVSYRWTIDGKQVASRGGRLEYTPRKAGRQEITVRVDAGRRQLGHDAWTVTARAAPPAPAAKLAATPRLLRVPASAELESEAGRAIVFEARVEPPGNGVSYRWTVDGKPVRRALSQRLEYEAREPGRHTVSVSVASDREEIGQASWVVAVRAEERPARVAATEPPAPPVTAVPEARQAAAALAEADVRRWLDDYAHAWSRKDLGTLRRMGQVRSPSEAAQLERYFQSIDSLEVDVRILAITVEGERASVEFERTDTVTDPTGRRQQLRLPPIRKEIERTPDGLRFAVRGAAG